MKKLTNSQCKRTIRVKLNKEKAPNQHLPLDTNSGSIFQDLLFIGVPFFGEHRRGTKKARRRRSFFPILFAAELLVGLSVLAFGMRQSFSDKMASEACFAFSSLKGVVARTTEVQEWVVSGVWIVCLEGAGGG